MLLDIYFIIFVFYFVNIDFKCIYCFGFNVCIFVNFFCYINFGCKRFYILNDIM